MAVRRTFAPWNLIPHDNARRTRNNAMARITTPDTVEVEMRFLLDGQQVENVFHVTRVANWDEAAMIVLASTFKDWWNVNLKPQVPTTLSLRSIRVTDLESLSGPSIEYTTGLPLAGTSAGLALPNGVSMVVRWLTALRGRSFRGRTYHLQLTEGGVDGNTINSGQVTTYTNNYQALLTLINTAIPAMSLCVLSEVSGGLPRANGICTVITGLSIDSTVDSQRRRIPGRGR